MYTNAKWSGRSYAAMVLPDACIPGRQNTRKPLILDTAMLVMTTPNQTPHLGGVPTTAVVGEDEPPLGALRGTVTADRLRSNSGATCACSFAQRASRRRLVPSITATRQYTSSTCTLDPSTERGDTHA